MKIMKIFGIVLLSSAAAHAANSGNLVIQGDVATTYDVVINTNASTTTLPIVAGGSGVRVGTIDETSNAANGYKITMASANAGKLVHTTDSTKSTGYTLSYNGALAVTLTALAQTMKTVTSLAALTTASSTVDVNVTAFPSAIAGTYRDTITVAIAAN